VSLKLSIQLSAVKLAPSQVHLKIMRDASDCKNKSQIRFRPYQFAATVFVRSVVFKTSGNSDVTVAIFDKSQLITLRGLFPRVQHFRNKLTHRTYKTRVAV